MESNSGFNGELKLGPKNMNLLSIIAKDKSILDSIDMSDIAGFTYKLQS